MLGIENRTDSPAQKEGRPVSGPKRFYHHSCPPPLLISVPFLVPRHRTGASHNIAGRYRLLTCTCVAASPFGFVICLCGSLRRLDYFSPFSIANSVSSHHRPNDHLDL